MTSVAAAPWHAMMRQKGWGFGGEAADGLKGIEGSVWIVSSAHRIHGFGIFTVPSFTIVYHSKQPNVGTNKNTQEMHNKYKKYVLQSCL